MGRILRKDILDLSVAERIELIGDLWDSMADVPEAIGLTEAQRAELDRRLDTHRNDPEGASPAHCTRENHKTLIVFRQHFMNSPICLSIKLPLQ